MHSYYLLIDDIIDRSLLRRGKPCWYRYNNIGEAAANDGILLDCTVYYIIRKYFNEKECYVDLIEVFHDVSKDIFILIIYKYKCQLIFSFN